MKNIAIITFLSENYGTVLQAYALQRALSKLGYNSEILRIDRSKKLGNNKRNDHKSIMRLQAARSVLKSYTLSQLFSYRKVKNLTAGKSQQFQKFLQDHLSLSSRVYSSIEELSDVKDRYDLFVCGSDMIWSAEYEDYLDIFFLKWVDPDKRVSYAPSFGSVDLPEKRLRNKYKESINGIRFLSCREQSGIDLIHRLTGKNATLVCDPTLLFTRDEWISSFNLHRDREQEPYILVNCFGGLRKKQREQVNRYAKDHRLQVRYLNSGVSEYIHEYKFAKNGYGPREFLDLVSDAKFHIVNGYHGLLFAIIFRAPFLVLSRGGNDHWRIHEDRMLNMLSIMGQDDRFVRDGIISQEMFDTQFGSLGDLPNLISNSWTYLDESLRTALQE